MDRRLTIALVFIVASFGLFGYALWQTNVVHDVQELQGTITKNSPVIRLVAMGDNHTNNPIFQTILDEVRSGPYQGFLHLGDSTDFGTTEEFTAIRQQLTTLPYPTIFAVGNHDIKPDLTRTRFISVYNQQPCSSHDIGHVHIIALDNADRKVGFPKDCLQFFLEDLKAHPTGPIIVIYHRPFNLPLSAITGDDETSASRRSNIQLLEYMRLAPNIKLVLSGHVHSYIPYSLDGVPAVVSGGGGDEAQRAIGGASSNLFHYVEITAIGDDVYTQMHQVQQTVN